MKRAERLMRAEPRLGQMVNSGQNYALLSTLLLTLDVRYREWFIGVNSEPCSAA